MSEEGFERELSELLAAHEAAPELPQRWEQRAEQAMAHAVLQPRNPRAHRQAVAIAVLVVIALCAVPYSVVVTVSSAMGAIAAQQAVAAEVEVEQRAERPERGRVSREAIPDSEVLREIQRYSRQAVAFVRSRYPDDPEMLMAAGLLAEDESAALALLKEAAETADTPPTWAAYVSRLLEQGPGYERLGTWGVDPGNEEAVAQAQRDLAECGEPSALTEQQARPLLTAVRRWQQKDPANALPLVIEVWCLYGLHQDQEAFAKWQAAGRLEPVTPHGLEIERAGARLLSRMGMRTWKSIPLGLSLLPMSRYGPLRTCARLACYEGRVAQMQGRAADAIAWWNSTISVGRHMQESATHLIDYFFGVGVQGIGATPAWNFRPDVVGDKKVGPLLGGRYYWGREHEFYATQVGEAADAELRDHLVQAKLRSQASREVLGDALMQPPLAWVAPLAAAAGVGVLLGWLVVLFAGLGSWRRRQADEATALRGWGRLALVAVTVIPACVGAALLASCPVITPGPGAAAGLHRLVTGTRALLLSGAIALVLPLLAAPWTRRAGARLRTACRGNLRRTLALNMLVCALLALGLAISGLVMQRRWIKEWYRGSPTEMERVVRALGPAWTNPRIPPDSWRAEYPPEVEPQR